MVMRIMLYCHSHRSHSQSRSPSPSLRRCRTSTLWSISTVWVGPSMQRVLFICAALCLAACSVAGLAQDLRVPASVLAGDDATIPTSGSGKSTFYLVGPGVSRKSEVSLGEEIRLQGQ